MERSFGESSGKLISLIIPAYNRQSTIQMALESAISPPLAPQEIIVVDDGSQDATSQVVLEMAKQHPSIRPERTLVHGGAPAARNWGAEQVRGGVLAFSDADNYWAETKLEKQFALLTLEPNTSAVGT